MHSLGESCQLWHGLFNIGLLMQFSHINSNGAINWINSDFVKVFGNSVTFYWAKCLSYSKQIGSILKSNICYIFWLASRRNGCNQYLDSLSKIYLFPLKILLDTWASLCCWLISLVVLMLLPSWFSTPLDHFNLPPLPAHPSPHVQPTVYTAVIFYNCESGQAMTLFKISNGFL